MEQGNLNIDHLISIAEAAHMLGVCTKTLRDWDATGKLTAVKTFGGHRRYLWSDIRKLMDGNTTGAK